MAGVEFLPREYGYVILTLVSYCFLNFWMSFQVGKARKQYKVPYPTMYATEAENKNANSFNCVQRGHQNSLEMLPLFFMLMIVGGIRHPLICASLGAVYIVSRYFYFTGYSTGDPQNRLTLGKGGLLCLPLLHYFTCVFPCVFTGYSTGDPQNRLTLGKYSFLAIMGLMICSISCGVNFLMS